MNGSTELLQLAHLLRVGATTAREIATVREIAVAEIYDLATQAETIASRLETIVSSITTCTATTPASERTSPSINAKSSQDAEARPRRQTR